ncbi:16S rRNA (adenine(1518)-N(6)/adenine(1519)-N(6))-dimethyltransferase RsmA [Saccharospirillum salsuginis]|uniref:Ribosomal RNA small subunit methyltransferase A n=1 Tax=Saccharospirillum salsuginis TaxID=418750 RepID=A0A918K365_9GAMM|nr:16S rRNA (adenine(1518)-N(6)/adenine(1519)-N(6))-dimethyltransferase RsmA [Saccharospirillum salsuginis]GGX45385.1 ribosomal RNA small subunit methyltransferase A [Saccharospirillum salsuginis]
MHRARKRFGQNFLHDAGIIDRIVGSIAPKPGQHMVEIGPGRGALTEPLLEATGGELDVVELDRDLIPILKTQFFRHENLRIHEADALTFDFNTLVTDDRPLRLVGNLPYNISTPLMFHLLDYSDHIHDMHFMLQKEVVQRLCAAPGDNAYGRLGIMIQYYCEARYLFTVPPGAFAPPPKVESAIVRLNPRTTIEYPADDPDKLAVVVRTAFNQRRKTLRNNLKPLMSAEAIESLGLNPGERAENLSIRDFVMLANHLSRTESSA